MVSLTRRSEPTTKQQDALQRRREQIQQLIALAEYLAPADRSLIRSLYDKGLSAADLAQAAGVQAQTIRRRARRLLQRMAQPIFKYVLRHQHSWPPDRRRVADLIFLQGLGQRETAAALNLTLHEVRQHAHHVQATFEQTLRQAEQTA